MDVVTGAFSFTGRYVAARLLELGREVRTLTRRAQSESPFGDRVRAAPLDFADQPALAESLRGADTLYNTYWIRFPRAGLTFEQATANTRTLLEAAAAAGVRRVVQLSVTNASADSPFPYFREKAAVEAAVAESGLSFAIVRPTLLFGTGEVLVNNVAWLLRRSPLFLVPGSGCYLVQPVAAEDVAELCVEAASSTEDSVIEAAGPDVFTFEELVRLVRAVIHGRAAIVHGSPRLTLALCRCLEPLAGDTVLTRDELGSLMASLLAAESRPLGARRFEEWLTARRDSLGTSFASDLRRPWG
ncbi:MAG TPA: NAD(P)H-binding protein [Gaiellaceae bacterium]|nr:NAD(P)H-binding protein [Gaiellaceae bacterium]